jgi:hypothetical protein
MLNSFETFHGKKFQMTPSQNLRMKKKLFETLNLELNHSITKTFYENDEIGYVPESQIPEETQFIKGYFQTWRYFEYLNCKPILSHSNLDIPTPWFDSTLAKMLKEDPFVLHIRRGDYRNQKNQNIGCLSIHYFEKLIETFGKDSEIWVFSDSTDEVKVEFREISKRVKFIKPPTESDPVESMILMSNARKIAISNSTFSWWAAKLGDQQSTVITPEKWFKGRSDPLDLIPQSWIKVRSLWLN